MSDVPNMDQLIERRTSNPVCTYIRVRHLLHLVSSLLSPVQLFPLPHIHTYIHTYIHLACIAQYHKHSSCLPPSYRPHKQQWVVRARANGHRATMLLAAHKLPPTRTHARLSRQQNKQTGVQALRCVPASWRQGCIIFNRPLAGDTCVHADALNTSPFNTNAE
jgi:hypothetical protein